MKKVLDTIYDKYDEDALSRWRLKSEARDFLSKIKEYGVKTAIVTNVGISALNRALQKFGIYEFFNILISRNDVQYLKPKGDGLELALRKLNLKKDNAIFIGNSIEDIQAAREVGLKVIIHLDEEYGDRDLLSQNPDLTIKNFYELI